MMLDLAETLDPLLNARAQRVEDDAEDDEDVADTTLQLVFFDGEEAFLDWTDTDSIYGARHLADRWSNEFIVPGSKRRSMGAYLTEIQTIEHLVLLDLLGAPQPRIRSYFLDTAWLFDAMISCERRLGETAAFIYGDDDSMAPGKWTSYFRPRKDTFYNFGHVGDDHVPFLKKDVSVLHLISEPFPSVWHTIRDDASALDIPTMRRWNLLLRVFFCEYLNLHPSDFHHRTRQQRLTTELVN
jgi:glutaminyl-peptide cyclotransferase